MPYGGLLKPLSIKRRTAMGAAGLAQAVATAVLGKAGVSGAAVA